MFWNTRTVENRVNVFDDWLLAFVITQIVEVPIYLYATKGRWAVSFMASMWTHPVVWFVFPWLIPPRFGYVGMVVMAECFAVLIEAAWLAYSKICNAFGWSLVANGASLGIGLLIRQMVDF